MNFWYSSDQPRKDERLFQPGTLELVMQCPKYLFHNNRNLNSCNNNLNTQDLI